MFPQQKTIYKNIIEYKNRNENSEKCFGKLNHFLLIHNDKVLYLLARSRNTLPGITIKSTLRLVVQVTVIVQTQVDQLYMFLFFLILKEMTVLISDITILLLPLVISCIFGCVLFDRVVGQMLQFVNASNKCVL